MRRAQFLAVFWTLVIAIPVTALALTATAYLTDNLIAISSSISSIFQNTLVKGRDLILEAEIVGAIAGQLLILAILGIALLTSKKEEEAKNLETKK